MFWRAEPKNPRPFWRRYFDIFLVLAFTFFLIGGMLNGIGGHEGFLASFRHTVVQVKSYAAAVKAFQEMYNALPGDMADAASKLSGCIDGCNPHPSAAGDGIIGDLDLAKSWKKPDAAKTHVPAISAADESVLFWTHLLLANLIGGVTDEANKNGIDYQAGKTHPEAKFSGAFIVGHLDGTPLPTTLSPKSTGIKGTVLLQVSDEALRYAVELNEDEKQPLTPFRAAQIDRKWDDGRAGTGDIQAYGSPDCFYSEKDETIYNRLLAWWENYSPDESQYNEYSKKKSCGLIFRIAE